MLEKLSSRAIEKIQRRDLNPRDRVRENVIEKSERTRTRSHEHVFEP
jgi:hypothetical protein